MSDVWKAYYPDDGETAAVIRALPGACVAAAVIWLMLVVMMGVTG